MDGVGIAGEFGEGVDFLFGDLGGVGGGFADFEICSGFNCHLGYLRVGLGFSLF